MIFPDKLAAQIDALRKAQEIRSWALVTGLVAAFYATLLVDLIFFVGLSFGAVVNASWGGGAIYGASSLIALGVIDNPSLGQLRAAKIGLWVGNLVVSTFALAFPIALPLALVPVIGGFVVIVQQSLVAGFIYLCLPFLALGALVLSMATGSPISLNAFQW